jgi:hypothetical protein
MEWAGVKAPMAWSLSGRHGECAQIALTGHAARACLPTPRSVPFPACRAARCGVASAKTRRFHSIGMGRDRRNTPAIVASMGWVGFGRAVSVSPPVLKGIHLTG